MQRLVALKISVAEGDEHKTLAQLDHPHIVRVFSQTVLEELELRLLYMQYHPGGTLKEVVDRMKRLSYSERNGCRFVAELDVVLEEKGATIPLNSLIRKKLTSYDWPQVVCWMGARLAEALDYSHGLGVLHRDLKPANVLLADDGSPKLADFNVSFSDRIEGSTPVANFGGSLAYMSPEQLAACDPKNDFRPEQLDARSDIYSLGILLWELLTGERPFPDPVSGTFGSRLLHDMTEKRRQVPDFDQLPAELPPLLVQALKSALVPNRDQRCPSATVLARELELCTDPEVQRILAPPSDGIHSFMLNFPIWTIVIMAFICNVVMSLLNIYYNSDEIIELAQMDIFEIQVGLLNVLCYGTAIVFGIWLMRPVRQALKDPEIMACQADQDVRLRVLHLGYLISGIGLSGWLICGILFPLGLHLMTGQSVLDDYVHFFASHAINGSLAAAAVFFLVSDFALEQIFPRVVRLDEADPRSYLSLSRFCLVVHVVLGYTICLPLVSVLLACLLTEKNTEAFAVLALLGLVGVSGAYRWSLKVRRNAAALMTITAS
jgi:serine/threonine protein kinase